ncbi:MAG: hypothetical protein KF873_06970 [Gemmataceae bacterium]|nr:hypothetical protein [Gemmataceae bacterium]
MAKFNLQQFLLAKGEKVALGLAAGGLGLLGVWGVMNLVSAKSPNEVVKKFGNAKQAIDNKMRNDSGVAPELPAMYTDPTVLDAKPIGLDAFPVEHYLFEPVDRPNRARENPKVLGIVEAQLDLVRLNMKAYDIKGEPGNFRIGVLRGVNITTSAASAKGLADILKKNDIKGRANRRPPPPPKSTGPGAPGGPMGSGGGGRGSMGGPPPGMGMSGGGTTGTPGSEDGGMYGGVSGGASYENKDRFEKTVQYIPVDEFDPAKDQPAFIIYPRRTIVMHAVFPLKEQLEVVRRALRLRTIEDAARETAPGSMRTAASMPAGSPMGNPMGSGATVGAAVGGGEDYNPMGGTGTPTPTAGGVKTLEGPTFAGFEVQRRIVAPNGTVYDWDIYDHVAAYLTIINNRKVGDQPDEGYLPYFLRYEQEMAIPLPAVADAVATYPPVTLPSIVRTINKMVENQKQPIPPSELQKRFSGKGSSPFTPSFIAPSTGGAGGGAGIGGDVGNYLGTSGSGMSVGRGSTMQGAPTPPPMGSGSPYDPSGGRFGPAAGVLQEIKAPVELEHMLIRFMDVHVFQGHTYEYRIRVKMKNPNYGLKVPAISKESDANDSVLFGPWVSIADQRGVPLSVTVPADSNTYLVDPVEYASKIRDKFREPQVQQLLDNQNGRLPVVQVQQWLHKVMIENSEEPIGTWIVADLPVNRGEFIGRKQLITLPLWSSQKVKYILQELPKYKVFGLPPKKEQPKGVLVDFTTSTVCVDYEGGKQSRVFGDRSVEDEGAVEMLILRPDGSVTVRNSGVDMANADRVERLKKWDEWIKRVEEDTKNAGQLGPPMGSEGNFGGATP